MVLIGWCRARATWRVVCSNPTHARRPFGYGPYTKGAEMNNRELNFTRRHFIRYAAGSTLWLSLKDIAVANVATPLDKVDGLSIRHVRVGKPTGLPNNRGDTWAVA